MFSTTATPTEQGEDYTMKTQIFWNAVQTTTLWSKFLVILKKAINTSDVSSDVGGLEGPLLEFNGAGSDQRYTSSVEDQVLL